uniref:Uncharacterized protein n=1 Tax=Moniliophthora roreri TaxID=221103 RepID=A0A0W0FUW5_MONRR
MTWLGIIGDTPLGALRGARWGGVREWVRACSIDPRNREIKDSVTWEGSADV